MPEDGSPPRLPSPLEHWERFAGHWRDRRPVVFLDFDGTLAPIVERPEDAEVPEATREIVRRLAERAPVAVVSGRGLDDVAGRMGLPDLYYAGSHGYEIRVPTSQGSAVRHSFGDDYASLIEDAARSLREELQTVEGAQVEPKARTVAVHDRRVAPAERPRVEAAVDREVRRHPELIKHGGKHVYEIRPDQDWHKGRAVSWLLDHLGLDVPDACPLYVGDDVTDEDAFATVLDRDGVAVLVSAAPGASRATWAVRHPDEVRTLLQRLVEELS